MPERTGEIKAIWALRDRRRRTLAAIDELIPAASDSTRLSRERQIELEERLSDLERYDRIIQRIPQIQTRSEPPVYYQGGPHSFFEDLALNSRPAARERLNRYQAQMQLEQRDIGTVAVGAIVLPVFLTEIAETARAGRPLLDLIMSVPLPDKGDEVRIPRITTGVSAAAQSAENVAVSETDVVETDLTPPLVTIAGKQDRSYPVMHRGSRTADAFIAADLAAATWEELDREVIEGSGASGEIEGILNTTGITSVTYTDATPSGAELIPRIALAAKDASGARKLPTTAVVMHSRRWFWLAKEAESSASPIVPVVTHPPSDGSPFVATIAGMGVLIDDNIPTDLGAGTDEDRIIVCRPDDLALVEGQLFFFNAPQAIAGSMTATIVGGVYCAFTAERFPAGVAVISGTGLVDPGTW